MPTARTALVVGASRGLGLVLAGELARRGWHVIATTRRQSAELQQVADASNGQLWIETLEMTSDEQTRSLRERLADTRLDLLFVNAAINRGNQPIHDVPTDVFNEVMITNALSPLRALETLRGLVITGGTVAVMSSEQGSISRNDEPGFDLYKASKSALNQLMRSYATRHDADGHTKLLIDPGHNQTELGGPDAPLTPQDTIPPSSTCWRLRPEPQGCNSSTDMASPSLGDWHRRGRGPMCHVLGTEGRRVVDASIFPSVSRANTNLVTIMAAELMADRFDQ